MSDMQKTDKWSRYWAGNRVSACMQEAEGQFKGNYSGSIGERWQQFFSALTPGSKVLDLATGNGAVLHFALDVAKDKSIALDLTGVDLAEIQPWAHVEKNQLQPTKLRFIPKVDITQLPFEDHQFDVVVSQYGAEYAPLPAVITEAARVLKPDGQLQWISHSSDSSVYASSCHEIDDASFILQQAKPHVFMHALLLFQAQGASTVPAQAHHNSADSFQRRNMDNALQACIKRLQQRPQSEILRHSVENLAYIYQHRSQFALTDVLKKLDEWQLEVTFYQARLQALVDAAMDEQTCKDLYSLFDQVGLPDLHMEPVYNANQQVIGTLIQAKR